MAELFEYKCPSCGALLKISPEESFVKCSYCGTIVQRELDDYEKASASAKKLGAKVEKYKKDMHELDRLKDSMLSGDRRLRELESKAHMESKMTWDHPLVIPIIIAILAVMSLFANHDISTGVTGLVFYGVAAVVVYGVTISNKNSAEKAVENARNGIEPARKKLEETKAEYESLKRSFDPEFIPAQYRNDQALDFIIGLFRTEQASTMGEAIKRYDEHVHQKKMEQLQEQQIALQKEQIAKLDHISANKTEEEIGSTAAKAGAAVVGTMIAGKIVKEIFKNL